MVSTSPGSSSHDFNMVHLLSSVVKKDSYDQIQVTSQRLLNIYPKLFKILF